MKKPKNDNKIKEKPEDSSVPSSPISPKEALYKTVLSRENEPYWRFLKVFTLFGADSAYFYCRALSGALTREDISYAAHSSESGPIIPTVSFYPDKNDLPGLNEAVVNIVEKMEVV